MGPQWSLRRATIPPQSRPRPSTFGPKHERHPPQQRVAPPDPPGGNIVSTEPQPPDHPSDRPSGHSPDHPPPTFRVIIHALKAVGGRLRQWRRPATRALLGEIAWRA